ncbi:MAG: hypothetical protein ACR2PL_23890, partial [Dehalococcoidia bacterium]
HAWLLPSRCHTLSLAPRRGHTVYWQIGRSGATQNPRGACQGRDGTESDCIACRPTDDLGHGIGAKDREPQRVDPGSIPDMG